MHGYCAGFSWRWRLGVATAFLFVLSGCTLLSGGSAESRLADLQRYRAEGDAAWQVRDNPAALKAYRATLRLSPDDSALALRVGYLYERLGEYPEAAEVYTETLKREGVAVELRQEMTYRLALLCAFRLNRGAEIPVLLTNLPEGSAYAYDLRAVQAILAGDGRSALQELNQARALPVTLEESSIILYHASRAYHLAGEVDRALQSLYEAINRAGYAPVARDIAEFREILISHPR